MDNHKWNVICLLSAASISSRLGRRSDWVQSWGPSSVLAEATALCSLLRPGGLIDTDEFSAGGNLAIAKHLVQWGVELFLVSSYRRRSR